VNFDHLHLLLNHVPIIGFFVGSRSVRRVVCGRQRRPSAQRAHHLRGRALLTDSDVRRAASAPIERLRASRVSGSARAATRRGRHAGLWFVVATALPRWWHSGARDGPAGVSARNLAAILLLAAIAAVLMGETGNTGGDIRHPQPGAAPGAAIAEGRIGSIIHLFEPLPTGSPN
jgi:hypothetical protein